MKKLVSLLATLALTLLAAGCGSQGSSADFPADFKVTPGDNSVIVTWTAEPDVEYWIFYGPGTGITTTNWATSGGSVIPKATSPRVVTGLVNGNTYSFTINGRKNGGPGGSGAPTQVAVPQLAGANWAVGTPLGTGRLNGVATGSLVTGTVDVAVGAGGAIFTSLNGAATTMPTNPAAPADLHAVWFATLGFVAAGANGTILTSGDATTWTARTSGTTATLHGGTSVGIGGFVAVGTGGTILGSSDGQTWTLLASGTTSDLYAAAFGNNRYVAVGAGGTIVTESDAAGWVPVASGTPNDLRGVAYAAITTATDAGSVVTSHYVAVGANGTVVTSNDGQAWTVQAPITTQDLLAVTYGGQFVAVGRSGGIFTSPDGVAWTARTSGTTNDLAAVARTLSGYTAVGEAGTNVSSF
ncbi:MAG: hypothetical protein AB7P08_02145 [Burkholderiales bacterium]